MIFFFVKKEGFENKNNCAFCIPIYTNHFNYGYRILKELNNVDVDVDIYFIFTDENEKDTFINFNKEKYKFNYLILSDYIDIELVKKHNCFASFKKFYALHVLYKKYKYLSCIDCEITFIYNSNFFQMMDNISKNKIICGGDIRNDESSVTTYKSIITDTLTRVVPSQDVEKLKKISKNYNIYTWWSNLPVYDSLIIPKYLNWIQFNNTTFIKKMNWNVFDDLLYNYFLILNYNYKLYIVPDLQHSLEYADSKQIEAVDKNVCKLYWVNKSAYDTNPSYYHKNNFYIIYHLDR
jgi:hypothetical protein